MDWWRTAGVITHGEFLSQFLVTTGNSILANVAGTPAAPKEFSITAGANEVLYLGTLRVQIRDSGPLSPTKYGNVTTLANGLSIFIRRAGGAVENRTPQRTIKSNADWLEYGSRSEIHTWGTDPASLIVSVDFRNHRQLELRPGDSYVVAIRDDLTGLDDHTFRMRGVRVPALTY